MCFWRSVLRFKNAVIDLLGVFRYFLYSRWLELAPILVPFSTFYERAARNNVRSILPLDHVSLCRVDGDGPLINGQKGNRGSSSIANNPLSLYRLGDVCTPSQLLRRTLRKRSKLDQIGVSAVFLFKKPSTFN